VGDARGPTHGWSPLAPTVRGWFEIATSVQIELAQPKVVRVWSDGSGGLFAPSMLPIEHARRMGFPKRRVAGFYRAGRKIPKTLAHVATHWLCWLPVAGAFQGSYFRALGPLLHESVPLDPEPNWIPRMQRPETHMTPSQRREADQRAKARKRRHEP